MLARVGKAMIASVRGTIVAGACVVRRIIFRPQGMQSAAAFTVAGGADPPTRALRR